MAKKIVKPVSKKSKTVKKVAKPVAKKVVKKVVKLVKVEKELEKEIYQFDPIHISKINRAAGQVNGVKKMIEEGRYCTEILTQLKAVRSAIKSLETEILEEYLQAGVASLSSGNAAQKSKKIAELKSIFVRFE